MKKPFQKIASTMALALLLTTVVSCNHDNKSEDEDPKTVGVEMKISTSISGLNTDIEKALNKLKELQFISRYDTYYGVMPVEFKQDNVKPADTTRVKAELMAEAEAHYTTALAKVNAFDFNAFFSASDIIDLKVKIGISFGNKEYLANIVIVKPLIWDKAWSTDITDCPVQEMSFNPTETAVTGIMKIQDGSEVQITSARRNTSDQTLIIIVTESNNYTFSILSGTKIQLIRIKPSGQSTVDVTDKNYFFSVKN